MVFFQETGRAEEFLFSKRVLSAAGRIFVFKVQGQHLAKEGIPGVARPHSRDKLPWDSQGKKLRRSLRFSEQGFIELQDIEEYHRVTNSPGQRFFPGWSCSWHSALKCGPLAAVCDILHARSEGKVLRSRYRYLCGAKGTDVF